MSELPTSERHAYLIMAHRDYAQLRILLELLDDPRNDIYLHLDRRAPRFAPNAPPMRAARLFYVKRRRVNWGGYSQIRCEMALLRAAAPGHYRYYHLLSGADLPLKTQTQIHAFFDRAPEANYLQFDRAANESGNFLYRVRYYYPLQDRIGRGRGKRIALLDALQRGSLRAQQHLGVCRRAYVPNYKGANWFSINDALAQYVLRKRALIRRQFRFTLCADEVFLQSIAMASPFRGTLRSAPLRAVDWERGTPYVYRREDVPALLRSDALFARKFDTETAPEAAQEIARYLREREAAQANAREM